MPAESDDEFEAIDDMGIEGEGEEIAEAEREIVGGAIAKSPYQFT